MTAPRHSERRVSPLAVRHRLEHAVLRGTRGLLRALPHGAAAGVGAVLGRAWRLADGRHRHATRANLASAFPDLSAGERRRLEVRAFEEYGAGVVDTVSLLRWPAQDLATRVDWEGWEHFEDAESDGRGVAVLSAHLGSFEVAAWAIGMRRAPVHLVTRRLGNPLFDAELRDLRRARGIESVERRSALRSLLRVLRAGGRIGFTIDQRVQPEQAVEAPFFGRRTLVSFGLALLSTLSGAPVVPISCHRDGGRYRVRLEPPLRPEGEGPQVVHDLTRRYLAATEAAIRRAPECWTWQHRIWRAEDAGLRATSSIALALRGGEATAAEDSLAAAP
jgi:KDO2-lipid IV(A) lauroyltransferase